MMKNPTVRRLVGAALTLIGLFAGVASGMQAFIQWQTSGWPTVDGRVVSSTIEEASGRRGRTNYAPVVNYDYTVNGTKYAGTRITIAKQTYGSESAAKDVANQYAAGSTVKVAYEASSPNSSVLRTGLDTNAMLQPALMVGLMIVGVVIVLTTKDEPATPA